MMGASVRPSAKAWRPFAYRCKTSSTGSSSACSRNVGGGCWLTGTPRFSSNLPPCSKMPRIEDHDEVRPAAFFVSHVHDRMQAFLSVTVEPLEVVVPPRSAAARGVPD